MDGLARPQSQDVEQETAAPAVDFRNVYKQHWTFVSRVLRRFGVPERELADVAQDLFMVVWGRLGTYDRSRPIRSWLRGFARNLASDYRRQARVVREDLTDPPERAAKQASADERLVDAETLGLITEILDGMDEERREVFELYCLDEVPMAEIAAAQRVPIATAHSRLRLARTEVDEAMSRLRAREEREISGRGRRRSLLLQASSAAGVVAPAGSDSEQTPSDSVARLIGLERRLNQPPPALHDQTWTHLRQALQLPPGKVDDWSSPEPPAPHGHGGPGAEAGPGIGAGPGAAPGPAALAGAGAALSGAHPLLRTVLALAVGGGAGAGVHQLADNAGRTPAPIVAAAPARSRPAPPPEVIAAEPLVPELPSAEPLAPEPPTTAPSASTAQARPTIAGAKGTHPPPSDPRERDRDLASERALIEQARTALWRHKTEDALAVLQRHARIYPHGALEEERESLRVRALSDADRADEARKAAASFHRQFPQSIFGAMVDEALGGAP